MRSYHKIADKIRAEFDPRLLAAYSVGALLYTPSTNPSIYQKIADGVWDAPYSLALCLEDAIDDSAVEKGEQNIIETLKKLYHDKDHIADIPNLFIRVRRPDQITALFQALGQAAVLLTGFIAPKFCPANAEGYLSAIRTVSHTSAAPIYLMPILESGDLVRPDHRAQSLALLKQMLLENKEYILNLRIGGNDLCHTLGIRRNVNETIYEIRPIANILSDIVAYFYDDFILSGPVWEYFADENNNWKRGLEHELRLDMLNGFIGKTVIHPNQIPIVANALKANKHDLDDAIQILDFDDELLQVRKSSAGTRMNEVKTHTNWARKQIILATLYGVR